MFYILSSGVLTKGAPGKKPVDYEIKVGDILHVTGSISSNTHVCIRIGPSPFQPMCEYPKWRTAVAEEEALIKTHILINGD